ncbi:MAG: hypothetical protein ACI8PZ_004951 [Myxococcota bacterium]|jgi:hypothetical protein
MRLGLLCWMACAGAPDDTPKASPDSAPPPASTPTPTPTTTDSPTDTAPPPPALVALGPNALQLTAPGPLAGTCSSPDDLLEAHTFATDGSVVDIRGLLANTAYSCVVAGLTLSATTEPLPDWVPPTTVAGAPLSPGYTLFNHWVGVAEAPQEGAVLVDPEGRPRWVHAYAEPPGGVGVDLAFVPPDAVLIGGTVKREPRVIGLDHVERRVLPSCFTGRSHHHHAEPLPDGDLLVLCNAAAASGDDSWEGFGIQRVAADDGLPFTWDAQTALDAGTLPPAPDVDTDDWWHANSVSYVPDDPDGPAYWVSLRIQSQIIRVDAASGEVTWRLGPFGDFVLLDTDGRVADPRRWWFGQHDPEVALPRVLVHDNGFGRPGAGLPSRTVEVELDIPQRTARIVWEHDWVDRYEPLFGDSDRLPDGGVLIAQGRCYGCPDGGLDPGRQARIAEVAPDGSERWALTLTNPDHSLYRAERIDGCAVFANQRYCPVR